MNYHWKSGDIALVLDGSLTGDPATCVWVEDCPLLHSAGGHWHSERGGWRPGDREARPLIKLDPEDIEDVRKFRNAGLGYSGKLASGALTRDTTARWQKRMRNMLPPLAPTKCQAKITINGTDHPCVSGIEGHPGRHTTEDITVEW